MTVWRSLLEVNRERMVPKTELRREEPAAVLVVDCWPGRMTPCARAFVAETIGGRPGIMSCLRYESSIVGSCHRRISRENNRQRL